MFRWMSLILLSVITISFTSCGDKKPMEKSAVVVVSFGTSFPETRKVTIEALEKQFAEEFKGWDIKRAFTSNIIRKVIKKKEGVDVLGPEEMLDQLAKEGYKNILVQSTHISLGAEYNELVKAAESKKSLFKSLKIGKALLDTDQDYINTAKALETQFNKGTIVLMGHGNEKHPEYNKTYVKLQKIFDDQKKPVHIGLVEGHPGVDHVVDRLKKAGIKEVTIMPFMIVAGDHANNDMAGEDKDSWKSVLTKAGIKVNIYLHGIGENKNIRDLYIAHAKEAK